MEDEVNLVATGPKTDDWCIDSGATSHLCNNEQKFKKVNYENSGTLNLANNSSTEIIGKGQIQLSTKVAEIRKNVTISDASCVPELRTNLLSVSKMSDRGYKVIFYYKGVTVVTGEIKMTGNIELTGSRKSNLYFLDKAKEEAHITHQKGKPNEISLELLHRKLGHVNINDVTNAVKKELVTGVKIVKGEQTKCETCLKGKMVRKPFPA